jgi:8-oxo-dGTP pyrophosphatase MutT (NUDIX family)
MKGTTDKKPEPRLERSAGGVVYRRWGRGAQVVLIATEGKDGVRWGLPKGLIRKSETPAEAAVREVREETGLRVEIQAKLPSIEYWFYWRRGGANVRHHKQVDFFLMRSLGGSLADHDHEVIEARWFGSKDAMEALRFKSEKDVLKAAEARAKRRRR